MFYKSDIKVCILTVLCPLGIVASSEWLPEWRKIFKDHQLDVTSDTNLPSLPSRNAALRLSSADKRQDNLSLFNWLNTLLPDRASWEVAQYQILYENISHQKAFLSFNVEFCSPLKNKHLF